MNKKIGEILTKEQLDILRDFGTEPPGSSPLNYEKREGDYHCVGCGTKLFESSKKYESGTGWPSFFDAIQTDPSAFLLELMGAISGLVCVWLLIKENIWTWPLGLVYALISLFVFYEARLFSDWLLHLYYVGMNGYGWYYWSRSSKQRTVDGDIAIIHMPIKLVFFITIAKVY